MNNSTTRSSSANPLRAGGRYLAASGTDIIEEAHALSYLIEQIMEAFPDLEGDLALWLMDDPPRLVGVLSNGVNGIEIRYL